MGDFTVGGYTPGPVAGPYRWRLCMGALTMETLCWGLYMKTLYGELYLDKLECGLYYN